MVHIGITGAAGNVGKEISKAFDNEQLTLFTHRDHDNTDSTIFDVTDRNAFVDALSDIDVLIHLAANPSPYAEWDNLREVNINGVYNAYYAAVENDLDRVVYASSNHAMNGMETVDPSEPETMAADAPEITYDDPPHPDSCYGITKVAGEAIGNYYARRHGIETVNVRIGWLMSREKLQETQRNSDNPYPEANARFARAMWLSLRDCQAVMSAAATAPISQNPLTVHAISRNDERCLTITHTLRSLGYEPRDNAAEVLEDSEDTDN